MKYKIEKNTVQETLVIPLYARKLCSELYPELYRDETAVRLLGQIDYDFSAAEKKSRSLMQRFGGRMTLGLKCGTICSFTRMRRWSTSAAAWTIPGGIATMASASFTIWIFRM